MNALLIFYLVLRALTLCVALLLGFLLLSAFVWVPFYASEGYTPQFQDRVLGLIGYFLLFLAIIIPYRWTVGSPYYQFRLGLIIVAAAWACVVDVIAFDRGLTTQRFTLGSILIIVVAALLYVALVIHRNRWKPAPQ